TLAAMVADASASHLFLDRQVTDALSPVAERVSARRVALDDSPAGEAFGAWLAPAGAAPRPVELRPEAAFNLIYSSGTTGMPKGIVQSNRMRWSQWQRATAYDYQPDCVTLVSTPLYSNTTLVSF